MGLLGLLMAFAALGVLGGAGDAAADPGTPMPSDSPGPVLDLRNDAVLPPEPSGTMPFGAANPLSATTKGPGVYDVIVVGVSTASLASEATAANSPATIARADDHWNYATRGAFRLDYRAFVPLSLTGDVCDLGWLTNASASAVLAASNNLTPRPGRTGVLIVHSLPQEVASLQLQTGCTFGLGYLGGISQYVAGYWTTDFAADAVAHEAGHNFLLDHANALKCTGAVRFSDNPTAHLPAWPCSVQEYHDTSAIMGLAVMGGGPDVRRVPFNQLQHLGVIGAGAAVDLGAGSGTVTLSPIDSAATGTRALRLRVPGTTAAGGGVPALSSITLEYRTDTRLVSRAGVFVTADAGTEEFAQSWAYVGADDLRVSDYGLKPHTRIRLADGRRVLVGELGATAQVTVAAGPVVPTEPRIGAASGTTGAAVLTYTAPADSGGATVTGYQASIDGGATWRECAATGTGQCTVGGLQAGQMFRVVLRAVNSVGPSRSSSPREVTIAAAPPSAPRNLSAVSGDRSATLTFSAPVSDGGQPITFYEYAINGGAWRSCQPASAATTCAVGGLTNGSQPGVAVRARNASGPPGDAGPAITLTPNVPPDAPTALAATPSAGTVAVAFSAPPTPAGGTAVTRYEYSIDDGATWRPRTAGTTESPLVITDLIDGVAYRIRVRAVNTLPGAPSAAVVATPGHVPSGAVFVPLSVPVRVVDTRTLAQPLGPGEAAGRAFAVDRAPGGARIVPTEAVAVAYNITAVAPADNGHLRVMPGDVPTTDASALNFRRGETIANASVVQVPDPASVRVENRSGASVNVLIDIAGYFVPAASPTTPGLFTALKEPMRVYDSGLPGLPTGEPTLISVADAADGSGEAVPAGAQAIAYTVTVVSPNSRGHLRVMPGDVSDTTTSSINWEMRGERIANSAVVGIDTNRLITIANGGAEPVRVLVDVAGYFSTSGAPFHPVSPVRAYDSRTDPLGPVAAAGQRTLAAATVQGNPSAESVPDGATGVAYNLTVTQSRGIGHFRLFPGFPDARLPGASVLNWPGDGYTRANAGFVGVAADRSVTLYNGGGDSHALLDVVGYFK